MVIWITGMSGTGKSTLASAVVKKAAANCSAGVILVDGDVLREVWGGDLGYSEEDRKINMGRMSRLCRFLHQQKAHVVAAVIAPFQETRDWNRANISDYYEVYIESSIDHLVERDPKGHYKRALAGESCLPGVNQIYERPSQADLIINNNGGLEEFLAYADSLAALISSKVPAK